MSNDIRPDDVFCPLVMTPVGKVPLIGSTMTDEREREIAARCGVPFITAVREKAQKAGLFLRKNGPTYMLQKMPGCKTVATARDIQEIDRWLDMRDAAIASAGE